MKVSKNSFKTWKYLDWFNQPLHIIKKKKRSRKMTYSPTHWFN